jgi:hypothetical protein
MIYPVISPVHLIGSLVYRTREALNKNPRFLEQIREYKFYDSITQDGKTQLWHYPGTTEEISNTFLNFDDFKSCKFKFPSVFNYQGTKQRKGDKLGITTIWFNLVFVVPVDSGWTTGEQDDQVFNLVLRDICSEFFNQIKQSRYFQLSMNGPTYELHDVYLNDEKTAESVQRLYNDYMAGIQVASLQLPVIDTICEKDLLLIEEENKKVTEQLTI